MQAKFCLLKANVLARPLLMRGLIAFLLGAFGFWTSREGLIRRGRLACDFTWPLRAAEALTSGQNPYTDLEVVENTYPLDAPFFYPLSAAIVAIPFLGLASPYTAGALFIGISSALMAYGLLATGNWRKLPVFASAMFFTSGWVAQWSPIIFAAALMPKFSFLLTCKPNLGLAGFLYRPTRRGVIGILLAALVTILVFPDWPVYWLANIANTGRHVPPIMALPLGPLLLISAFFWRRPEARLLLSYAVIPHLPFFYDPLLLWLIPKSLAGSMTLSGLSWVAYVLWSENLTGVLGPLHAVIDFVYLPALLILLIEIWRERRLVSGRGN